ncbi:BatA domain-containing protein [Flavobacteriaceae bacterium M23B6Z8]
MQFKNPEVLWALFLLLIPVIVHLFQLRRFQKVPFTNVKFLKEVVLQTRKSRNLKKWLVLISRLLLLAMLIIAFAQPYIANRNILQSSQEMVIYLDNSFSMQAPGKNGPLFDEAVQELIKGIDEESSYSLFTNTDTFREATLKSNKEALLGLNYSQNQLSYNEILLKAKNLFSKDAESVKNLVVISDFQNNDATLTQLADSALQIRPVVLRPTNWTNISIDSVYVKNSTASGMEVNVVLKRNTSEGEEKAISLYNKGTLVAKAGTDFQDNNSCEITFTLPSDQSVEAQITLDDTSLFYDNSFYFTVNNNEKINVLSINGNTSRYLERIYTKDEFNLITVALENLNFSDLEKQHLIILNELRSITPALLNGLNTFKRNGGTIIFIPSLEASLEENNLFLKNFGIPGFSGKHESAKKITDINFDHPVFKEVFEKRVSNFQYPQSLKGFTFESKQNGALNYQDQDPFLFNRESVYVFSAPLGSENSNFKNSPLIVPVFYNIALKSFPLPKLYYQIGAENTVAIQAELAKDEVLSLVKGEDRFIPLQRSFSDNVILTFNSNPTVAGIYDIVDGTQLIKKLSFNYQRTESLSSPVTTETSLTQEIYTDVASFYDQLKKENRVTDLWKWFVIFALGFLIIEILLLKFLK